MNRTEIIAELSSRLTNQSKKTIDTFLREFCELIQEMIEDDKVIKIADFGTFLAINRQSTRKHNPFTGKIDDLPPKRYVRFKPCKKFGKRVACTGC